MNILVTGGNGLVGSALKEIKNEYKYNFIFLSSNDCDLTNYTSTYNFFKYCKPDYVIHLAANVGGLYKNMEQKVEMLEKNILINFNVVKCSHEFKIKKLISCLSTCIFPDNISYPINEYMLHDGKPHDSNFAYAYTKRMLDIHSRVYREQYGDNFICIIPTNIYGKHDNYNLDDAHVIPSLIHKCFLAKKNNEQFIIKGSGTSLRQFIYSTDLAKLIMLCLEKYDKTDNIILSVSEKDEVSIEFIAREIANIFDYNENIFFDKTYSDGQYKKTVDNSKLLDLFENFEFTDIKKGLNESVKWFIENYDNCRK